MFRAIGRLFTLPWRRRRRRQQNQQDRQYMLIENENENLGLVIEMKDGRLGYTHVEPPHEMNENIAKSNPGPWTNTLTGYFVPYYIGMHTPIDDEYTKTSIVCNTELILYRFSSEPKSKQQQQPSVKAAEDRVASTCPQCWMTALNCHCEYIFFPYHTINHLKVLPPLPPQTGSW